MIRSIFKSKQFISLICLFALLYGIALPVHAEEIVDTASDGTVSGDNTLSVSSDETAVPESTSVITDSSEVPEDTAETALAEEQPVAEDSSSDKANNISRITL